MNLKRQKVLSVKSAKGKHGLVKRNAKSSVFTHLFSLERYRKELYLSFHPSDRNIREDEIKTYTISSIFTNTQINDLGLLVKDVLLLLVEAQSTWTYNILPRIISYLAESYNRYVKETNQDFYGTKKVKLPKPELYVIYTGKKKISQEIISFKKEFFDDESCPIDIKVMVITLKNASKVLKEYIRFTKKFDENIKRYGYTRKSISDTIEYCVSHRILKDYLVEYEREVDNIMTSLYDQKTATKMYGRAQYAEGVQQGRLDGILELFKKKVIDVVTAAQTLNMTEKEFLKLAK